MDDDFTKVPKRSLKKFTKEFINAAKSEENLEKEIRTRLQSITKLKEKKVFCDDYYNALDNGYHSSKKKAGLSGVKEDTIQKAARGEIPTASVKPLTGKRATRPKKIPPPLEEGLDEAYAERLNERRNTRKDELIDEQLQQKKRLLKKRVILDPSASPPKKRTPKKPAPTAEKKPRVPRAAKARALNATAKEVLQYQQGKDNKENHPPGN